MWFNCFGGVPHWKRITKLRMEKLDLSAISYGLQLGEDGIWYSECHQKISYPSHGNAACFAVEENSFWFNHRNNCIATILKAFPPVDGKVVFDIGGGNGFVSLRLVSEGFNVVLLEPGITGCTNAKSRGIRNVICATTDTAKFMPASLPAVGLFDVIEHIQDDLGFLQSLYKTMKRNGLVYLTVPAYKTLWSSEDEVAGHYNRYSLKEIIKVLKVAGFKVDFSSYFFCVLPLPILLIRTIPYRLGMSKTTNVSEKLNREHNSRGGVMSNILKILLKPEINYLGKKRSMMFGGSCIVVARK